MLMTNRQTFAKCLCLHKLAETDCRNSAAARLLLPSRERRCCNSDRRLQLLRDEARRGTCNKKKLTLVPPAVVNITAFGLWRRIICKIFSSHRNAEVWLKFYVNIKSTHIFAQHFRVFLPYYFTAHSVNASSEHVRVGVRKRFRHFISIAFDARQPERVGGMSKSVSVGSFLVNGKQKMESGEWKGKRCRSND